MRTIPYSLIKSSTKDLSLPIFELVFSLVCARFDAERTVPQPLYDLGLPPERRSLYVLMITSGKAITYRRFPAWILA